MDKVKKLVLGNINLVLALLGVFILLISYLVGYQNLTTLNTDMESTLEERSDYLAQLKEYYAKLPEYRASVAQNKANISKNIARLPKGTGGESGIKEEDFLLYIMAANKEVGGKLSSVAFSDSELISEFETLIGENKTAVAGYRTSTTSASTMTYEQLKKYLAYVYDESKELTYVDSVSISYDSESANLSTVWNLSKFYIEYEGGEYEPVKAPDVAVGKKNLFGTK